MRSCSIVLLSVLALVPGWAADEFEAVKCGADVPKAMVGRHSSDERVVVMEARHSNLGLKDLGGMEISDRLFLNSWRICGSEYAVLVNTAKHLVRDVIRGPIVEGCQVAGKEITDAVIAILDNSQRQKPKAGLEKIMLPAKMAWKIDESQERFVPRATEGLTCAVSGSSADLKQ
jgi:hypothetical protein